MNILYLTNHLNVGGITSYVFSLARSLREGGDTVYVASSGGERVPAFSEAGIVYLPIPLKTKSELSPKIIASLARLLPLVRRYDIQIIHANTRVTQVLAFFLERFSGVPYVSTCHGFFTPRLTRRLFPLWGRRAIAISEPVKRHLRDDLGVKEESIRLIHNGVDSEHFKSASLADPLEFRGARGIGPGPLVGIVARLSGVKGHACLIRAIAQVVRTLPEVTLLVVGQGREGSALIGLTKELGIEKNIVFIPAVQDTRQVLGALDLFVMPSLHEGLGLSLMEAMACGVAVIGSDVGGITTLIRHEVSGLLVPAQDPAALAQAILRLLHNPEERRRMGEAGRAFIAGHFSLRQSVTATRAVYEECRCVKS